MYQTRIIQLFTACCLSYAHYSNLIESDNSNLGLEHHVNDTLNSLNKITKYNYDSVETLPSKPSLELRFSGVRSMSRYEYDISIFVPANSIAGWEIGMQRINLSPYRKYYTSSASDKLNDEVHYSLVSYTGQVDVVDKLYNSLTYMNSKQVSDSSDVSKKELPEYSMFIPEKYLVDLNSGENIIGYKQQWKLLSSEAPVHFLQFGVKGRVFKNILTGGGLLWETPIGSNVYDVLMLENYLIHHGRQRQKRFGRVGGYVHFSWRLNKWLCTYVKMAFMPRYGSKYRCYALAKSLQQDMPKLKKLTSRDRREIDELVGKVNPNSTRDMHDKSIELGADFYISWGIEFNVNLL